MPIPEPLHIPQSVPPVPSHLEQVSWVCPVPPHFEQTAICSSFRTAFARTKRTDEPFTEVHYQ